MAAPVDAGGVVASLTASAATEDGATEGSASGRSRPPQVALNLSFIESLTSGKVSGSSPWNSGLSPASASRNFKRKTVVESTLASNPYQILSDRVVVVMVGLPARGKSYISKAIVRYLNFLGCPARLFNAGNKRRQEGAAGVQANFFDANNLVCCPYGHGSSRADSWLTSVHARVTLAGGQSSA